MRPANARTVANVLLGGAALGAAFLVWRQPVLRRAAGRLLKLAIGTGLPAYLMEEVAVAWAASGPPARSKAN